VASVPTQPVAAPNVRWSFPTLKPAAEHACRCRRHERRITFPRRSSAPARHASPPWPRRARRSASADGCRRLPALPGISCPCIPAAGQNLLLAGTGNWRTEAIIASGTRVAVTGWPPKSVAHHKGSHRCLSAAPLPAFGAGLHPRRLPPLVALAAPRRAVALQPKSLRARPERPPPRLAQATCSRLLPLIFSPCWSSCRAAVHRAPQPPGPAVQLPGLHPPPRPRLAVARPPKRQPRARRTPPARPWRTIITTTMAAVARMRRRRPEPPHLRLRLPPPHPRPPRRRHPPPRHPPPRQAVDRRLPMPSLPTSNRHSRHMAQPHRCPLRPSLPCDHPRSWKAAAWLAGGQWGRRTT